LFSSARLYKALKEAEYPDLPSERTVRDWIKNDSAPQGARIYAAKALGIKKEAPAEAGADEIVNLWLERWHDAPEPHWAQRLTQQIIATIETDREAAILSLARELGGSTYEQLREHLRRLRAESSQEATDQ
jgi:hypothetical protein